NRMGAIASPRTRPLPGLRDGAWNRNAHPSRRRQERQRPEPQRQPELREPEQRGGGHRVRHGNATGVEGADERQFNGARAAKDRQKERRQRRDGPRRQDGGEGGVLPNGPEGRGEHNGAADIDAEREWEWT